MDIKIVGDNGQIVESKDTSMQSEHSIDAPVMPEIESKAIGQVLGIEEGELAKNQDKINTLLEYAKSQTDDHSVENLKWVIRNLEFKLGTPKLGEKLINYLTEYAYLVMEGKKIEKEKQKFEK